MNADQVEGVEQGILVKLQEEFGKLFGSPERQGKEVGKQIFGNAKKIYGDAKEAIKSAGKHG